MSETSVLFSGLRDAKVVLTQPNARAFQTIPFPAGERLFREEVFLFDVQSGDRLRGLKFEK